MADDKRKPLRRVARTLEIRAKLSHYFVTGSVRAQSLEAGLAIKEQPGAQTEVCFHERDHRFDSFQGNRLIGCPPKSFRRGLFDQIELTQSVRRDVLEMTFQGTIPAPEEALLVPPRTASPSESGSATGIRTPV